MAGKPLQQLFWNRSVNKHWKYSVQVKCVYGESFFLPVSTWPQACDGFYYLKSHFVISLEAELEKFCSSCWPCLPASCSTWCQGQGASLCQEMVPTWDPLLHTTGLLQSCRWTGVSSGGERAQNSEPAPWEGRALLAAQWRKNICFLQVSVETEYAVQGEPGSVVVRLRALQLSASVLAGLSPHEQAACSAGREGAGCAVLLAAALQTVFGAFWNSLSIYYVYTQIFIYI